MRLDVWKRVTKLPESASAAKQSGTTRIEEDRP